MDNQSKNVLVEEAERTSKFFEFTITIRIFGHIILNYTWPPKKS